MAPMIDSSVVLPLPDGPIITRTSPRRTSRSTSSRACTAVSPAPYTLLTPRTAIADASIVDITRSTPEDHRGVEARDLVDRHHRRRHAHHQNEHEQRHRQRG